MDNQFDYIWKRFLTLLESEISRTSQADVARRLGVNRGQVSKWLSGLQVGGNLKTFVAHLENLGVPLSYVVNSSSEEFTQSLPNQWVPSEFEKNIAHTLNSGAKVLGKKTKDICAQAFQNSNAEVVKHVEAMLKGKKRIDIEDFYKLCKAIRLSPEDVLNRAAELTYERTTGGEDSARRTA